MQCFRRRYICLSIRGYHAIFEFDKTHLQIIQLSGFQQGFGNITHSVTGDKCFHSALPVISHPVGRDPKRDGQEHSGVEYENGDEGGGAVATHDRVYTPSRRAELDCLEGERSGNGSEGSEPKSEKAPYNVRVSEEDAPRPDEEKE